MSEIKPALSADEWHAMLDDWSGPQLPKLAYEMSYLWGESRPFAAMAICNAALADDDPRKITYADIVVLRQAAEDARANCYEHGDDEDGDCLRDGTLAVVAKLAALLPPNDVNA